MAKSNAERQAEFRRRKNEIKQAPLAEARGNAKFILGKARERLASIDNGLRFFESFDGSEPADCTAKIRAQTETTIEEIQDFLTATNAY